MNLKINSIGDTAVVALAGEIDLQNSPRIRKGLMNLMSEGRHVLVDLTAVAYIDSSGIASLVEAFQTARKNGTRFALAGVSGSALRVLQLAKLDKVFLIHGSVDEALKAGS